jgi:hypothetical protein
MNEEAVVGSTHAYQEVPGTLQPLPYSASALCADEHSPWTAIPVRRFSMHKHDISLRYDEHNLFAPNAVTRLLAKIIQVRSDDVVVDLGSGVGPLAIWAALEPSARVHAVELLPEHCELLRENLALNGVADKVNVYEASLFDAFSEGLQADVIVADVSGIAEDAGRCMGWYPPRVPTGGLDGTAVIVPLLLQSRHYLKPDGRLYFPVGFGMADGEKIMDVARSCFERVDVLSQADFPMRPDQYAEVVRRLPESISRKIVRRGSRYAASGIFCEAMNPVSRGSKMPVPACESGADPSF